MFTQKTLEEIRERVNLVDLIGEYVELKKSGSGFSGRCPFHKEKTPSFHVHPVKQIFHCFGCHKGGNLYTFLREIEGITFPEAVEKLASRAGVEPEKEKGFQKKRPEQKTNQFEKEYKALEWAAKYFHYLLNENEIGKPAKTYLERRGLSQKTIDKFQLGYSPQGWNTLRDAMIKRGFDQKVLVSAGLVVEKDPPSKGSYDRFRERVMFPIRNPKGNVIGFGARILKEEKNQPKYLNSVDSPLFSKRRELFGLYENQREIRLRGEAIVVEGYMDVIGLYEKGVPNAIASMGTALTPEHCQNLKKHARRVVTVFDPDGAGREASHRSVGIFIDEGIFAKDLTLPEGKDPDEFVLSEGAEKFFELCEKAPRQITKLLKEIAAKGPLSEEAKAQLLKDLNPILIASRKLPDRALLWDSLALTLNLSVEAIAEMAKPTGSQPRTSQNNTRPSQPIHRNKNQKIRMDPLDEQFVKSIFCCRTQFQKGDLELWLKGLTSEAVKKTAQRLHGADESLWEESLATLSQLDNSPLASLAAGSLLKDNAAPTKEETELFDAVSQRVRDRAKEREIQALSKQVKLAQQMGDESGWLPLLEKLKELRGDT